MDINAHLKVEIVLNEDENEEEKRFNEIICYDSDGDSSQENEQIESVGMVYEEVVSQNVQSIQEGSMASNSDKASDVRKTINAERMRKYRAKRQSVQQKIQPKQLHESAPLSHKRKIKYDSPMLNREEREYKREKQRFVRENLQPNQQYGSEISNYEENRSLRRSNAAQMRKYRAKQRSDPVRYQQYLERERIRNYKRKYEKRIEAAQQRAIEMGIPYIVLEPEGHIKRGRRPKFPDSDVTLVLPAKYEDDSIDESNSFNSDDMPMIPCKVELQESDELYQERKPNISVVNINKLMNYPRSALQTLLPQEVHDREQVSNFIQSEHDYVKKGADNIDPHKLELLKLQQQCRNFVLSNAVKSSLSEPKRDRRFNSTSTRRMTSNFVRNDCNEQHEDLDDLFKELAEVANREPPKKMHSSKISPSKKSPQKPSPHSSKTSPHKKSPHKKSAKRSPLKQLPREGDGEFSLTVSMPVQPLVEPKKTAVKSKKRFDIGRNEGVHALKSTPNDINLFKKVVSNKSGFFDCNEDSIEIKEEPIDLDDIKQEPVNFDDNLF